MRRNSHLKVRLFVQKVNREPPETAITTYFEGCVGRSGGKYFGIAKRGESVS